MGKYQDLLAERKELIERSKDIEQTLEKMREEYTQKAREQNLEYIYSIPEEDKKVLLKYIKHNGGTCKLNYKGFYRDCLCPRCRLEDIFNDPDFEYGKYKFEIEANISTVTWDDYKEE